MYTAIWDKLIQCKGGGIGLGYEVPFQTLPDTPLDLDEREIADIIAFTRSLSDPTPKKNDLQDSRE